jgi:hypothetical protein
MSTAQRRASFSFPIPLAPTGHWIIGVILLLIGLGGIAMGGSNGLDFRKLGKDGAGWIAGVDRRGGSQGWIAGVDRRGGSQGCSNPFSVYSA